MNLNTPIEREDALWSACAGICNDAEFVDRLLDPDPRREAYVLAYGPVARRNQFQALLYASAYSNGFRVLPIAKFQLMPRVPWPGRLVCHFHWLHERTRQAATVEEADAAVDEWARLLREIKARNAYVVWTVHNVMPHECRWHDHDKKIHQMMADAADVIHVMTRYSAELCEPYYHLPAEKQVLVPHPSYVGAQPDWISRSDARAQLGISPDAFVFLSFGAVLAYKGYGGLMQAYEEVSSTCDRPVHLVIAGQPADTMLVASIRAWAAARRDVTLDLRPVPSEELQVHFRAADVAVCPYERTLNSGAALMAITFDVPIIGPRVGAFIDSVGDECGILYEGGSIAGLAQAMSTATRMPAEKLRAACAEQKVKLAPRTISDRFFSALRERLSIAGTSLATGSAKMGNAPIYA